MLRHTNPIPFVTSTTSENRFPRIHPLTHPNNTDPWFKFPGSLHIPTPQTYHFWLITTFWFWLFELLSCLIVWNLCLWWWDMTSWRIKAFKTIMMLISCGSLMASSGQRFYHSSKDDKLDDNATFVWVKAKTEINCWCKLGQIKELLNVYYIFIIIWGK